MTAEQGAKYYWFTIGSYLSLWSVHRWETWYLPLFGLAGIAIYDYIKNQGSKHDNKHR